MLGLVRMLDRPARRHGYGVGEIPRGEIVGELGSLHAHDGAGRTAAWLTTERRLVTSAYEPAPPPVRVGTIARWVVAPLSWRGSGALSMRLRTTGWRAFRLPWLLARRGRRGGRRPDAPAGWLDAEGGPRSVPLFSGVHPVTGDQLLTNDRWEAVDLGYVDVELLGYLDAAAPLTGTRATGRPELPWVSRLGQVVRTDTEPAPTRPTGEVEGPGPEPVTAPFAVRGWALARQAPVATVEILVDGEPIGRARLGLPRPDVAEQTTDPNAPVCGFDALVRSEHLPAGATQVTVTARARDLEGGTFGFGAVDVAIAARPSAPDPARGRELRERTRRRLRSRPAAAAGTNVLVVTHRLDRGGAQLLLHELIERLVARPDMSLTVVAATDGPLRGQLEGLGVPVRIAGDHPTHDIDEYERALADLAAWAGPHGFDIALVNALRSFPAVELADLIGVPSVFAIHESYDLESWWATAYPRGTVHPYVEQRGAEALRLTRAAVFEAEATRALHVPHGEPHRFITMPFGIELEAVDRFRAGFDRGAARDRLGLPADATVVLCLGLIEPRKAQTTLAQVFGALADQHPSAVLALVGESALPRLGPHNDALHEYLGRAELAERVHVVPMADNPYEWLGVADLLVCPSDVESLPRVVLEAMAFELPVVATRIFGLPEVIEDGRTGWLCEPRDAGALAGALDRALCAGRARGAELGREAARVVRARHDAAAYAGRFAALLEGLAADPGADPAALAGVREEHVST